MRGWRVLIMGLIVLSLVLGLTLPALATRTVPVPPQAGVGAANANFHQDSVELIEMGF